MEKAMERVLMVMNREKMNARTFCAYIRFGYSTFNNYISGIRAANNFDLYKKVLNTFVDINAEWLIRGEGPMLKTDILDNNSNDITVLLEKIDKQQDTIISQSREIGRLEGRIEELEKKYILPYKSKNSTLSKAATPTNEYKKKENE